MLNPWGKLVRRSTLLQNPTMDFRLFSRPLLRPRSRKVHMLQTYYIIFLITEYFVRSGLTYDAIGKAVGRDEIWVASALLGQVCTTSH